MFFKHLLTLAESVTCLGIEIDETLSWNNHIEVLAKRFNRTNEILSKLRYYIPTETDYNLRQPFSVVHFIWFNNLGLKKKVL